MYYLLQIYPHKTKLNICDARKCRKLRIAELQGMEVDENEGDLGARLRPIFCSLGEITRADGSVMLCQVSSSVFGLPTSVFIIYMCNCLLFRETQL